MNFKQVEAFRVVVLSGSMTAAARELHTSQPNISRLIAQLERQTGLTLFERKAGRLMATPEAQALFQEVQRAFVGLDTLERAAQGIARRGTGLLRVGCVPSMALTLLPRVVHGFAATYPDVGVTMQVSDSVSVAQWTASGYCDVGIVSFVSEISGVEMRLIGTLEGVCILPPAHRLAACERPLVAADLEGEKFVSLTESDGTRRYVDSAFTGRDTRVLAYTCQYAAAICEMVGLGLGVSIVNPAVAYAYRHTGVVTRRFSPRVAFRTFAVSPAQRPGGQLGKHFIRMFARELAAFAPETGETLRLAEPAPPREG